VKRAYLFLGALVALGSAIVLIGQARAQTPGGGAPARTDTPRVAVFNVAKLMQEFNKWQYYAVIMDNERKLASAELIKMKNDLVKLQEAYEKEPQQAKRDSLMTTIRSQRNAFEDREKQLKDKLDEKVNKHLKELFQDVNDVVKVVAETYGYDIIFAYPEATTQAQADRQEYIDLKLRPPAAMPFYVNKKIDVTDIMLPSLNKHRMAPAAIPAAIQLDPKTGEVLNAPAVTPTGGQK